MLERFDIESQVRQRAQRDPEFRARLTEDPRATLEHLLGVELGDVTVRVVEEDAGEVVVVLPPPAASTDLTDAELAGVAAGGTGWGSCQDSCGNRGCTEPPSYSA
ncbi:MAG TPA: NHLP leader peptide family RiPP precursor [Nitriliruptoraceae bacterium]|nr:NHLP leader peptide family RiPP precursor [Nitriliruptoraceae bacterium]